MSTLNKDSLLPLNPMHLPELLLVSYRLGLVARWCPLLSILTLSSFIMNRKAGAKKTALRLIQPESQRSV